MIRRASLVQICVYLTLVTAVICGQFYFDYSSSSEIDYFRWPRYPRLTGDEPCNQTECPGPLMYYESLGCKPVYEQEDDCCPSEYNCDHLRKRAKDKCYVDGKEYEIGERLKAEDANPCDVGCICRQGYEGIASFICEVVDCPVPQPGCYRRLSASNCCGEIICPPNHWDSKNSITCLVNGRRYKEGQKFTVEGKPHLSCLCLPGYEGKNVEPFCVTLNHSYCSPDFYNAANIHNMCTPVYSPHELPQTSCNKIWKCQNDNDIAIPASFRVKPHDNDNKPQDNKDVCHNGNQQVQRNHARIDQVSCAVCICDTPPTLTCRILHELCRILRLVPRIV